MATTVIEVPGTRPALGWPVSWTGVWVGALAAIALWFVFGLAVLALGAHLVGPSRVVLDWKTVGWAGLVLNVVGPFLAFVVGGWAAAKLAGPLRSEPAILHGAIAW